MFLLPIGGITVALILVGFFGAAIFSSGLIIPITCGLLLYVFFAGLGAFYSSILLELFFGTMLWYWVFLKVYAQYKSILYWDIEDPKIIPTLSDFYTMSRKIAYITFGIAGSLVFLELMIEIPQYAGDNHPIATPLFLPSEIALGVCGASVVVAIFGFILLPIGHIFTSRRSS